MLCCMVEIELIDSVEMIKLNKHEKYISARHLKTKHEKKRPHL